MAGIQTSASAPMGIVLNEILTNELYMIITAVLLLAVIFSAVKKITKLLIYSFAALAAFIAYLYFTGVTVADTIEQGQEAVEEAKETADEKKKEIEDAKEKAKEAVE